jgi:hypothetical protein
MYDEMIIHNAVTEIVKGRDSHSDLEGGRGSHAVRGYIINKY